MSTIGTIVLAAGKGKRMGGAVPKVLSKIWGRPLIDYVLDAVEGAGLGPPILVIGHGAEEVRQAVAGRQVSFVRQREMKGTGDAIKAVRDQSGAASGDSANLLILYGDVPGIRHETLRRFLDEAQDRPTLVSIERDDPFGYGRILRDGGGAVVGIREEAHLTGEERSIREVNAGTYLLPRKELFESLDELPVHESNGETYLTDVVEILCRKGLQIEAWKAPDPKEFSGVNRPSELTDSAATLQQRIAERHMAAGVEILDASKVVLEHSVRISPGVRIHPYVMIEGDVSIESGTEILPFTVIRGTIRIGKGCEVGPFSHLRDGTVLEDRAEVGNYTETKKAKIGSGTKAKHLSYLGDVEIGRDVNIGAGTIVANYDGKKKHKTQIGDHAFVGSGTVLVAPVKIGEGAMTGAGAVVTRNRDVSAGEVVVGVPARPLRKDKSRSK
ncbi:MAG: bifunctional UDP-N-acetylglucosamine diphosphorylase/glucosamine-1-phosphate N-acetyltransferase GlmU, partial [Planctomycetota bacterium]|nr:bifunctional UDP-N-acetylglucosamine diphosphorylase/glucosamine-1-phosphate N-acetyltransferase GlmU [Planctomycetota bacterium]